MPLEGRKRLLRVARTRLFSAALVRYVARILGIAVVLLALPVIGGMLLARGGTATGLVLALVGALAVWLWLPRLAHTAFETGKYAVAGRRYAWLEWLATTGARERAARLSRAGCAVAAGDVQRAEALLAAIDATGLAAAERAVWLNNRACAQLASGDDPAGALAMADEAGGLRPDVPALQHTRAMALIAVGRIDEAITILDGMRAGGELPPRLEADRCRELARAWTHKGETAYAEDYRLRADLYSR
jgi:predicted Zn-dependent protease